MKDPLERFDDIECETVSYGAWNTGTRTIYKTKIPLWEESVRSGHPLLNSPSPPRFTAWPKKLPEILPIGALKMGDSDPYFGAWIEFDDALSAFNYVEQIA